VAFSLLLAACVSGPQGTDVGQPTAYIVGSWKLMAVAGAPVLPGTSPTLTFSSDGHANGNGGCNAFGGSYTRAGDTLTFSHMISTMMACTRPGLTSEQVMGQERRFLSALNGAVHASQPETDVLVLTTASGEALRLERAP
ncbi:MAG: META domain-containing protein, partial [Proteobacteria bacterium]|nr:META domain-containing protein [Pseudomonadota bacterium]